MTRVTHMTLTASERVLMAHAHTCHEARALVLALAPGSAQAKRVATGLDQLVDYLWPTELPRQHVDHRHNGRKRKCHVG